MKQLSLESQSSIIGGAQTASCIGGILTGLVGGAGTGFQVGKYLSFVGIGWGTAIGALCAICSTLAN